MAANALSDDVVALAGLTAGQAVAYIRDGKVTSEELVSACLARIADVDGDIEAWAYLDTGYAHEQAKRADAAKSAGMPLGPLHGVPVALKDNMDTADMPTENGTPLHAGRRPEHDACIVSLLREAGAVILGKTVTTEVATRHPGKTRNPHNPAHTPGGSSSGSAAAVASAMAPLALGTQTNGSVIRPASYCGVYGFKPSFGWISRTGILAGSQPFDTVGAFARDLGDIALVCDVLMRHDPADPTTRPVAPPQLAATISQDPPARPRFAYIATPYADQAAPSTLEAFDELAEFLGEDCVTLTLSEPFAQLADMHALVMNADIARNFGALYDSGRDQMSDYLRGIIEDGRKVSAVDYNRALEWREVYGRSLEELFENVDAVITPATPGEAPGDLATTGDPIFSTIWTFCGLPTLTMPLLQGPAGLPLGVQLVGAKNDDGRLLRTARWLNDFVEAGLADEE